MARRMKRHRRAPTGPLEQETPSSSIDGVSDIVAYLESSLNSTAHKDYEIWLVGLPDDPAAVDRYPFHTENVLPRFVPVSKVHKFTIFPEPFEFDTTNEPVIPEIDSMALKLLQQLSDAPPGSNQWTNVILVGYGLGGVIMKQALLLGLRDIKYLKVILRLSSMIPLAADDCNTIMSSLNKMVFDFVRSTRRRRILRACSSTLSSQISKVLQDFESVSGRYRTKHFTYTAQSNPDYFEDDDTESVNLSTVAIQVRDYLTQELANADQNNAKCHDFLIQIDPFKKSNVATKTKYKPTATHNTALELLKTVDDAAWGTTTYVVGSQGSGKSTILRSLARELSKDARKKVVEFSRTSWTALSEPEAALPCSFISEILLQQPQLFSRIEYFVDRRSQFGLRENQFLKTLLSAIFNLKFLEFVVIIDDFESWGSRTNSAFKALMRLARSTESKCKFVISIENEDEKFDESAEQVFNLEEMQSRNEALQAQFSDLFRNQRALEFSGKLVCDKIRSIKRSAVESVLILKILSCYGIISAPSAVVRHLSVVPTEATGVYTYFLEKLQSRSAETRQWTLNCLSWVLNAARPLREQELACAAGISSAIQLQSISEVRDYISGNLFADLDLYTSVFVKKEDGCILSFHKTVLEFLYTAVQVQDGASNQDSKSSLGIICTHESLTRYCLEYISTFIEDVTVTHSGTADGPPILDVPQDPAYSFLSYACVFWPHHYSEACLMSESDPKALASLNRSVLKFLASPALAKWYEVFRANMLPFTRPERYDPTPIQVATDLGLVNISLELARPPLNTTQLDTCLDLALKRGHFLIAEQLLELEVKGNWALHLAAEIGDVRLIKRVVNNGIAISAADNVGSTALHIAVQSGHLEAAKVLLELSRTAPDIDGDENKRFNSAMLQPGQNENSMLHFACLGGDLDTVLWVFNVEPDIEVDRLNCFKETPLHLAAAFGHYQVVKHLVSKGADVQAVDRDNRSPLQLASKGGHIEILTLLVQKAGIGLSPLQLVAQEGHLMTLKSLTTEKNLPEDDSLSRAASNGHTNIVRYMINCGADPNDRKKSFWDGRSPLAGAASKGHTRVIQTLLIHKANVNLGSGPRMDTPLHYAASCGQVDAVLELLRVKNCNVNARNTKRETPLHLSTKYPRIVELLLKDGADQRILDKSESTPLHHAAEKGSLESVNHLLEGGADIASKDDVGFSPINYAIRERRVHIASYLLSKNKDLINAQANDGATPLHHAAKHGLDELVANILALGADVDAKDHQGRTPLHNAAEKGHTEVVEKLLQCSAQPDSPDERGRSALHCAASNGHFKVVEQLLRPGVGINRQDEDLRSPLWLAAFSNHANIVKQLSEHKASLTLKDNDGWSALHAACDAPEVTELLIDLGVDVNDKTKSGTTALMLSAINSCPRVVNMLIDAGANLDERSHDGSTALHYAIQEPETLTLLMRKGADLHLKDLTNKTCLQVAADFGDEESLSILLGYAKELEGTPTEWTEVELLDALLSTNHTSCAKLLMEKSNNIADMRVAGGYTALQRFFLREEWHMAVFLVEKGADPWSHGGPFVSAVHLVTHLRPPTPSEAFSVDYLLNMILSEPNNSTPPANLSRLQLALELKCPTMWKMFHGSHVLLPNLRDSDGWTLENLSSRANDPFGPIEEMEEPEPHQFLEPSALLFPKPWEIGAVENPNGFEVSRIEISSDGLEVGISCPGTQTFRADRPFPPRQAGVDYFEVTVLQGEKGNKDKIIAIGMCSEFANLGHHLAGHRRFSLGYHSDDGKIYEETKVEYKGRHESILEYEEYGENDTVGCGVNWDRGEYFFTLNGRVACSGNSLVIFRKLYPVVSLRYGRRSNENIRVRVNFRLNKIFNLKELYI